MIVGCVGVYSERVDQALVCIKRLRPHVDRYVVIIDETVTEEQKQQLRDEKCEVYFHEWEDSMVKMRNQYLKKCQTDDWVIVHDPDEWFCKDFCRNVRRIIQNAEKEKINLLLINSHDITIMEDGSKAESKSDFYKNLIYKYTTGVLYQGVGEIKEVHEILVMPSTNAVKLDDVYFYEHTKYWHEVWERAFRNVFMAGGGNNMGEKNPQWKLLREICDNLDIKNWTQLRDYCRRGEIHEVLAQWFIDNRRDGFDFRRKSWRL